MSKRIGILGAGGIGSVVGGLLADVGYDVTLIDPWFEHIAAIKEKGLLVKTAPFKGDDNYVLDKDSRKFGHGREIVTRPTAIHFKDLSGVDELFDMGFIAVNGYDTEWATTCLNRYVKPDGAIYCFQNGINDDKIAAIVGAERTLGVIMTVSAAVYDPGVALRTDLQKVSFKVGELDGQKTPRAQELADMLTAAVGPSFVTPNLWGQRWSKLMVNTMNNALAGLTGWKTAYTRTHPSTQPIGIQLAAEAVCVARACGYEVEPVMNLTPDTLVQAAAGINVEQVLAQLTKCASEAGGASRPSFGQDVVKGRRTEIDQLNGYVARKGREKGVSTPFCTRITEIVHSLGVGFTPSPDHILPLTAMLPNFANAGSTATSTTASTEPAPTASSTETSGDKRRKITDTRSKASSRLRVACVGAGYFAQFHHDAWARIESAEFVALCDQDKEKAQTAAIKHGVQQVFTDAATMLSDSKPDVLDIVTPPSTHLPLVELAVKHGVPYVVCQKPLAPTLEEARSIVELAERAGVLLIVHENFRFEPWYKELQKLLHDGAIGACYSVSFRLRPGDGQGNPPAYVSRQPYFQHMERFLIHETGIHFVDVFRYLFGEVQSVYADLRRLNPVIAGEDAGTVVFTFADGQRRAVLDCNRLVDHDADNTRLTMGEMLIEGSDAVLRLDGRGRIFIRKRAPAAEEEHTYSWDPRGFGGDSVFSFQAHVVSHLLHSTPLANSGHDYLRNVEIVEAIYQSSIDKRQIALPVKVPTVSAELVLPDLRTQLGEGPIWDCRRRILLFVDILRAKLFEYNPVDGKLTEHDLSKHTQHVSTVIPVEGSDSEVMLGTTEGMMLFDLDSRAVKQHPANGSLHGKFTRMNDGKCDPQGRLWIGSVAKTGPDDSPTVPGGAALYVLERWSGTPSKVIDEASISNGITWSSNSKTMYWIDSGTLGVDAFDFNGAASTHAQLATRRRRAVTVSPSKEKFPDGCAIDSRGHLWVVVYGAGEVRRFDVHTGEVLAVIALPSAAGVETTACAFGGEDLDELYITTVYKWWSAEKRTALSLGGALFKVSREALARIAPGIRGMQEHHFRI